MTTEFVSVADVLKRSSFKGLRSLSDAEILRAGHIAFFSIDGQAYDLDIKSEQDISTYRYCRRCNEPNTIAWVKAPHDVGGDFIAVRCMNEPCRGIRERNQCGIKRQAKHDYEIERAHDPKYLKRFGVPEGYLDCSLDTFRNHGDFKGAVECVQVCQSFIDGGFKTLLVIGNTGTGKTHLAVGIIRKLAESGEKSMRFESAARLMSRFKDSYDPYSETSESSLLNELAGIKVLVVDDFGVENRTSNSVTLWQQIVDDRCSRQVKTVITSNLVPDKLKQYYGDRLVSRLTSTTGKTLHITAPDYRKAGVK